MKKWLFGCCVLACSWQVLALEVEDICTQRAEFAGHVLQWRYDGVGSQEPLSILEKVANEATLTLEENPESEVSLMMVNKILIPVVHDIYNADIAVYLDTDLEQFNRLKNEFVRVMNQQCLQAVKQ